jgi:hypothetical protein
MTTSYCTSTDIRPTQGHRSLSQMRPIATAVHALAVSLRRESASMAQRSPMGRGSRIHPMAEATEDWIFGFALRSRTERRRVPVS